MTIFHCKKKIKGNLKGKELANFGNFSIIGKLKLHDEDYHYEINETNEIFITESEYQTSEIQHHFTIKKRKR